MRRRHIKNNVFTVGLIAALVACGVTNARLLTLDKETHQKLKSLKSQAGSPSGNGSLTGLTVVDERDWPVQPLQGEQNDYEFVVLFPFSLANDLGGVRFWDDVAVRTAQVMSRTQFVGVCAVIDRCGAQPNLAMTTVTLLSSMDPLQMRAVEFAKAQKAILLYRDSQLSKVIRMDASSELLANEIVEFFKSGPAKPDAP